MTNLKTALPRQSWRRIWRVCVVVNAASVALSVLLTNFIMEVFSAGINVQGLVVAIVTPLTLGGPMLFVLMLKHEQLRHANNQLRHMAGTDWLTQCANRGAFTTGATSALADARGESAMLVIDADEFKSVNDRFGHDSGDDALRLIAAAIARAAPKGALVGRLGGEEFAVFVPGTNGEQAHAVAQAIRDAVAAIVFAPHGKACPLSVSVGAATTAEQPQFAGLYRLADQRLYGAKADIAAPDTRPNVELPAQQGPGMATAAAA
ncbi:MAG: GGDEF domain-containing protein [Alphaproteobacteria bacterium]|nr:GGDEF domain-containing protein [Alphaproteobacteria bacterium]